MKAIILAAACLATACATTTFNGADLSRLTAASAIGAIAAVLIFDEKHRAKDQGIGCPTCPPLTPAE